MYRAITLIEILTTFVVMAISLYFLLPVIFHLPDPVLLNNEIDRVKSFLYQVQTKARYQQQRYSITVKQPQGNKQWCMIAIAKKNSKQTACDCSNINSCNITGEYYLYTSQLKSIKLISNSLYPKVFMNIDGVAGRLETVCLGLSYHHSQQVLQFDSNGIINVAQQNKRTKCRELS